MKLQTKCLTTPKTIKKGTYFSAASTVEAALVLPLFMYASLAVIYILQITAIRQHIQQSLYETAGKLAGYVYSMEKAERQDRQGNASAEVPILTVWTIFINELGTEYAREQGIVGGNAGFDLLQSRVCERGSQIELCVTYTLRDPFDIFGIGLVTTTQSCRTDAWLGEEYDSYGGDWKKKDQEEIVYITAGGEVYHKEKSCTYLTRIITEVKTGELDRLTNHGGEHYEPCKQCMAAAGGDKVYVTEYGTRYHTDRNCAQLSRIIIEIPISKTGNRTLCEKCGGSHG